MKIAIVALLALSSGSLLLAQKAKSNVTMNASYWNGSVNTIDALSCSSYFVANSGGWRQISTAPRDGTPIELIETFGFAPTYDLDRWDGSMWASVTRPSLGYAESNCLLWRPHDPKKRYIDPTNGAQNTVHYWCKAIGAPYNKKTGYCKK